MERSTFIFISLLDLLSGISSASIIKVLDSSFPDPSVVYTGSEYYAFGTTGNGVHAQVATSTDFLNWKLLSGYDGLPAPFPKWVGKSAAVWAPDVLKLVQVNLNKQNYISYV